MLNKKDLIVMAYLRQDARMKLTKMSRLTRMPVSTIFDRMKHHEGGLIRKHICLLDFDKMGFHTRANVMFSVAAREREQMQEYLRINQNVNSIYKINNGFDLLAEFVFRDVKDLDKFLDGLDKKFTIKKREVHYLIDDIKRESFMSDPNTIDMLNLA